MNNNPWNKKMTDVIVRQKYINMLKELKLQNDGKSKHRVIAPIEFSNYLERLYFKEEYGIKMMARGFGVSYTIMRNVLINYMTKPIRKGQNITTKRMNKFRSERVLGNKNPWYDWVNQNKTPILNSRGIQGYYTNKLGKKIWLRSTWEYIYAKWLDKNNILWKIEEKSYKLKNGENYRPDFFIYNNNDILQYIVEVKGYYKNRLYKYEMFKKEYNIKIILVDSINDYIEEKKGYREILKEWKQITHKK